MKSWKPEVIADSSMTYEEFCVHLWDYARANCGYTEQQLRDTPYPYAEAQLLVRGGWSTLREVEDRFALAVRRHTCAGARSWKPEVIADSSGKWFGNALRFATEQEALDQVLDLSMRWLAVQKTRVVESDDPVNYRYVDHKLVEVKP